MLTIIYHNTQKRKANDTASLKVKTSRIFSQKYLPHVSIF